MRYRVAIAIVLAVAVIGGSAGCASNVSPSSASVSPTAAIQSLTLASLAGSSHQPQIGKALAPSAYKAFLVGHVAVATPTSANESSRQSAGVAVTLDQQGTAALAAWSTANRGKQVVILFDGKVVSTPVVQESLSSGHIFVSVDASSALGDELIRAARDSQMRKQ